MVALVPTIFRHLYLPAARISLCSLTEPEAPGACIGALRETTLARHSWELIARRNRNTAQIPQGTLQRLRECSR